MPLRSGDDGRCIGRVRQSKGNRQHNPGGDGRAGVRNRLLGARSLLLDATGASEHKRQQHRGWRPRGQVPVPDLDWAARDELRPRSSKLSSLLSNGGLKTYPQKLIDPWSGIWRQNLSACSYRSHGYTEP